MLDEDSGSASLVQLLTSSGYDVTRSVDALGNAAPDDAVAALAQEKEGIVLSKNAKDFRRLIGRQQPGKKDYPNAGSVLFCDCKPDKFVSRLTEARDLIEAEVIFAHRSGSRPICIEIYDSKFVVYR